MRKICSGRGHWNGGGRGLGMTMAPSHRQIKRAAHMAAKRVNEAVENLAEAMDPVKAKQSRTVLDCPALFFQVPDF